MNLKEKIQQIKFCLIDSYGWIKSVWIYLFRSIERPGIFYGYNSYELACKYAEKRAKNWKSHWDQMGRQQGVWPLEETSLIVASRMELKIYKKKEILNKSMKPRKAMKKSYYTTKDLSYGNS